MTTPGCSRPSGPKEVAPTTVEYDALGRIVGMQAPGSPRDVLGWDGESRLVERARGDLAMRWRYDADGERAAVVYPDGSEATYTRDASGYAVRVDHPALGSIELERDGAGRLVGATGDCDAGALESPRRRPRRVRDARRRHARGRRS